MIEILTGVFYDPTKEWYEQPEELIALAIEVEQTAPIDFEIETTEEHDRVLWAKWQHETELGLFEMLVEMYYLYSIDKPAFLTKAKHNKVTITKLN